MLMRVVMVIGLYDSFGMQTDNSQAVSSTFVIKLLLSIILVSFPCWLGAANENINEKIEKKQSLK